MNIQHEIKDGNLAIITLKLEKTEVESRYQKDIKDVVKKTNMPGFRPGNAPKGLIEQKYGAAVRFEALNGMVNEGLNEYIGEQKFAYYGMPMSVTDSEEHTPGDTFDFKFELGLRPEVELKLDSSMVFNRFKVSVGEKEIQNEIDLITRRHGTLGEADAVESTDMLNGDFVECNDDGTAFEGGISTTGKSILFSSIKDEGEKAKFLGKKVGDVILFDIFKTFGNDTAEISQVFGIAKEAAADLNHTFSFTLQKIQRLIPAELNDDLYAKYNSETRPVKTLEDLKAVIETEIGQYYASQAEGMMEDDMIKGLVKAHKIRLPDAFLLRWIKQQNKDKNEHEIEHDYLHEKEYLKWSIIRDIVFDREQFTISAEEVEAQYQLLLSNYMRRFGYDPNNDMLRHEFETKYFKREEQEESAVNIMRTAKALVYIKEHITINEVPIDSKAFDAEKMERSKHEHDHAHDHDEEEHQH
jgi:trigger factor